MTTSPTAHAVRASICSIACVGAFAAGLAGCGPGPSGSNGLGALPALGGLAVNDRATKTPRPPKTRNTPRSYLQALKLTRQQALKHKFLFAGGAGITVYQNDQRPLTQVGTITTGVAAPYELAVDRKGTLYVANDRTSAITVYPLGETSPSLTIPVTGGLLIGVAVDRIGTVYASDGAYVYEYLKGMTTPSATIHTCFQHSFGCFGLALDKQDNLYVVSSGESNLYEIPYGSTTPQAYPLNEESAYTFGLAIADDGTLYLSEENRSGTNYTGIYMLGSPNLVRTLQGVGFYVGLDHKGNLYGPGGTGFEAFHPERRKPFEKIDLYGTIGMAAYPPP